MAALVAWRQSLWHPAALGQLHPTAHGARSSSYLGLPPAGLLGRQKRRQTAGHIRSPVTPAGAVPLPPLRSPTPTAPQARRASLRNRWPAMDGDKPLHATAVTPDADKAGGPTPPGQLPRIRTRPGGVLKLEGLRTTAGAPTWGPIALPQHRGIRAESRTKGRLPLCTNMCLVRFGASSGSGAARRGGRHLAMSKFGASPRALAAAGPSASADHAAAGNSITSPPPPPIS